METMTVIKDWVRALEPARRASELARIGSELAGRGLELARRALCQLGIAQC